MVEAEERSAEIVGCLGWQRAPGVLVAAGSRPRTPGWWTEGCGCWLPGVAASYWRVGCCWIPAADAGMGDGGVRLLVAWDGSELLACGLLLDSRLGTPGWRTEG